MGQTFKAILQRRELCTALSIAAVQCGLQQEIREFRILGQNGTVRVRAENIPVTHALTSILPVVAVSLQHPSEGETPSPRKVLPL